ncbi:hypothetical protein VTN00DRAFT_2378 [Thermoascus crustaceus]|uniref:uncharacterized protein n=1 Tax=Thermoascus crustaceus TaxID=5088 RepID=UPI0037446B8A
MAEMLTNVRKSVREEKAGIRSRAGALDLDRDGPSCRRQAKRIRSSEEMHLGRRLVWTDDIVHMAVIARPLVLPRRDCLTIGEVEVQVQKQASLGLRAYPSPVPYALAPARAELTRRGGWLPQAHIRIARHDLRPLRSGTLIFAPLLSSLFPDGLPTATMYHLAKSLYLYATSKEEYSVLLLGLDNAGKTTLLSQIKALYLPPRPDGAPANPGKTVPTVGQNVATIPLPDMYLKIWDVGGQISMRGLWQSYYASCHAIIFVVDSADVGQDADIARLPPADGRRPSSSAASESTSAAAADAFAESQQLAGLVENGGQNFGRLDECRQVLESVLQHADVAGVPILVLANKQDREDCVEVVRIKEGFVRKVFEGEKGGGVRDSRVLPVSALLGTGVQEAVEWVRSRVKWNKEGRPPVMR